MGGNVADAPDRSVYERNGANVSLALSKGIHDEKGRIIRLIQIDPVPQNLSNRVISRPIKAGGEGATASAGLFQVDKIFPLEKSNHGITLFRLIFTPIFLSRALQEGKSYRKAHLEIDFRGRANE